MWPFLLLGTTNLHNAFQPVARFVKAFAQIVGDAQFKRWFNLLVFSVGNGFNGLPLNLVETTMVPKG